MTSTATFSYLGTEETVSAGTSGFDLFGGVEFPLRRYGFPLTVFGGVNYLGFGNLSFSYEGESLSYPLGISGTSFHVGLKFEF